MIEKIEAWLADDGRDYKEGCLHLQAIGERIGDYGLVSMAESFMMSSPMFNMGKLVDQVSYEMKKLGSKKEAKAKPPKAEVKAEAKAEVKAAPQESAPSPHPTPEAVTDEVPLVIKQCKTLVAHLWQRQQMMQRELYALGTENTRKAKEERKRIIDMKLKEATDHSRLSEMKERYFSTGEIDAGLVALMREYEDKDEVAVEHKDEENLPLKLKKAKQNVRRNEELLAKTPKKTPKWNEVKERLDRYEAQVREIEDLLSKE